MADKISAVDRLDENMRYELTQIVASWRMEKQELTPAEIEILALYLLGEIDSEECQARMIASQS